MGWKNLSLILLILLLLSWLGMAILTSELTKRISVIQQNVGADPSPAIEALKKISELQLSIEANKQENLRIIEQVRQEIYENQIKALSIDTTLKRLQENFYEYTINSLHPPATISIPYSSSGYALYKTEYGTFVVIIESSRAERNGVEVVLTVINPTLLTFGNVEMTLQAGEISGTVSRNIVPKQNFVKILLAPIKQEDINELTLTMPLKTIMPYN